MTDYELLQLAAQTIGFELEIKEYFSGNYDAGYWTAYKNIGKYNWNPWDPLKDDGDAFRLAAKLGIDVIWNGVPDSSYEEYLAIARRAIVKAAAKIGQNQLHNS